MANEEVINGLSERGNHPVVRQPLRQWVLKITQFADRLEQDLDGIQWPDGTLQAQKQWIGRSVGAAVTFKTESGGRQSSNICTQLDLRIENTFFDNLDGFYLLKRDSLFSG